MRPLRAVLRYPHLGLALLAVAVHLCASGGYGYFRDELYFIVCGTRPDWGYVDQPPLVPLIAAAMHGLFGDSLVMLRLVPAIAHAATIALAGETARELGGGRWAQGLAGLAVLTSGVYLALGTILVTDVLQAPAWLFCAYALIRIVHDGEERWWLALGAAAALGMLSKYTIVFWLAALGIGVLATGARRSLARPWVWIGLAIAILPMLPNLLWQAAEDWPFLEIGRVAVEEKNLTLTPLQFLREEIMMLNPAVAPIWIVGLAALALWRRFRDLRLFAVTVVVLMAAMLALRAKPYYPAGVYPLLLAAGAVTIEAGFRWAWTRIALMAAVVAMGIVAAPFSLPILPVERFVAYQSFLGQTPHSLEHNAVGPLPQYYADMFGWPELAALVGRAYHSLAPEEQAKAVFLAGNYGEAGAIDVLGKSWGLPPAISGHNNYFLWGPRGHDGSVVLRLGGTREELLRLYNSVEPAGDFEQPWAMPYETGRTLWICRGRKTSLIEDWPRLRNYR